MTCANDQTMIPGRYRSKAPSSFSAEAKLPNTITPKAIDSIRVSHAHHSRFRLMIFPPKISLMKVALSTRVPAAIVTICFDHSVTVSNAFSFRSFITSSAKRKDSAEVFVNLAQNADHHNPFLCRSRRIIGIGIGQDPL